jgi:hypothetical protein
LVTNVDFEKWGEYLADPPLATAFGTEREELTPLERDF